jgi:hypothetical protein
MKRTRHTAEQIIRMLEPEGLLLFSEPPNN